MYFLEGSFSHAQLVSNVRHHHAHTVHINVAIMNTCPSHTNQHLTQICSCPVYRRTPVCMNVDKHGHLSPIQSPPPVYAHTDSTTSPPHTDSTSSPLHTGSTTCSKQTCAACTSTPFCSLQENDTTMTSAHKHDPVWVFVSTLDSHAYTLPLTLTLIHFHSHSHARLTHTHTPPPFLFTQDPSGVFARHALQPIVSEMGARLSCQESLEAAHLRNPLGQHGSHMPLLPTPTPALLSECTAVQSHSKAHALYPYFQSRVLLLYQWGRPEPTMCTDLRCMFGALVAATLSYIPTFIYHVAYTWL